MVKIKREVFLMYLKKLHCPMGAADYLLSTYPNETEQNLRKLWDLRNRVEYTKTKYIEGFINFHTTDLRWDLEHSFGEEVPGVFDQFHQVRENLKELEKDFGEAIYDYYNELFEQGKLELKKDEDWVQ